MIQILNPNKEKLVEHITQCQGDVYMNLNDGTSCNLKSDPVALHLLKALDIPKNGIFLSLSDPKDFSSFVRYLMEDRADAS